MQLSKATPQVTRYIGTALESSNHSMAVGCTAPQGVHPSPVPRAGCNFLTDKDYLPSNCVFFRTTQEKPGQPVPVSQHTGWRLDGLPASFHFPPLLRICY